MAVKSLAPYQAKSIIRANKRLCIWEGSVRSGKTISANLAWVKFVTKVIESGDTETPLLMAGKTERTLKRNVIDPMTSMLGPRRCRFIAGLGELRLLGKTVYVAGANDERSADRLQGLTLMGAYVDEASLVPESFWTMLTSRLSMPGAQLFATSNPDSSNHWLIKKYLSKSSVHMTSKKEKRSTKEDALDLIRFSFRLPDNPHLPRDYVRALAKEYKGLWKLRYIDGLWVIAEGAVYPMYGEHLIKPAPQFSGGTLVVGIDYGTTNPFAAVVYEITNQGIKVFAEWGTDEPWTDGELSRGLRDWMAEKQINPKWICVDPSAASFKRQLYRDGVRNMVDADNSVSDGIRMVASLMSLGLLDIDPKCEQLNEEIPGYRWDPDASAKGIDKPIKKADHYCDALRYGIATCEPLWRHLFDLAA
jgi:PBSX family phage terminase large subunit